MRSVLATLRCRDDLWISAGLAGGAMPGICHPGGGFDFEGARRDGLISRGGGIAG